MASKLKVVLAGMVLERAREFAWAELREEDKMVFLEAGQNEITRELEAAASRAGHGHKP